MANSDINMYYLNISKKYRNLANKGRGFYCNCTPCTTLTQPLIISLLSLYFKTKHTSFINMIT